MFKENNKAIYLQIADTLCDGILSGIYSEGERLPSVREYAATMQVNPNTMMRTYDHLSGQGLISNRRGIGFFVEPGAAAIVREKRVQDLLENEIYDMFRQLELLGVTPEELKLKYEQHLNKTNENNH